MTAVVAPARVDVGALAGTMQIEASKRVASALTSALVGLEDNENGLNEVQKAEVFAALLCVFDGFERTVARELVSALRTADVDVWGLPDALEDLASDAS